MIYPLTNQMIADQITTAFEGGSNYWIDTVTIRGPDGQVLRGHESYSKPGSYSGDFEFHILEWDEDEPKILNREAVEKGWALLSSKYPDRYASIIDENCDAEDADVFLQVCLFGDIVYG